MDEDAQQLAHQRLEVGELGHDELEQGVERAEIARRIAARITWEKPE